MNTKVNKEVYRRIRDNTYVSKRSIPKLKNAKFD